MVCTKIIYFQLEQILNNAGKYNRKITIYQVIDTEDSQGFPIESKEVVLQPYAKVKTTRGFTLIANDSDFEKAYTNFTIRYSQTVINAYYNSQNSNRDMLVAFNNKTYSVQYLNNIDEANVEIEMQCKEVMK